MNSEPNILELPSPGANATPSPWGEGESPIQNPISNIRDPASSIQNPPIQQSTDPPPADTKSQPSTLNSQPDGPVHPAFGTGKRGNGYVARLPKDIRDQLNTMILDGIPYAEIIQRLGEPAKHLQPSHLKEWKKYGYQDWLLEREWLDRLSSKAEFSTDILAAPHSSDLHEAGLRIAASQMFDQLMRFNAASQTGASDQPEKFARLVNALSRLTREALAFQKYRDALADAIIELQKRDPDRDLAAQELLLLVNKMDKTFKVARPTLSQLLAVAAAGPQPAQPKPRTPLRPALSPQPEGLADGSRRSEPAETSGTVPRKSQHPGGMPDEPIRMSTNPSASPAEPLKTEHAFSNSLTH